MPGKFHGQRSLGGYDSRGRKEWDMTEYTRTAQQLAPRNRVEGTPSLLGPLTKGPGREVGFLTLGQNGLREESNCQEARVSHPGAEFHVRRESAFFQRNAVNTKAQLCQG